MHLAYGICTDVQSAGLVNSETAELCFSYAAVCGVYTKWCKKTNIQWAAILWVASCCWHEGYGEEISISECTSEQTLKVDGINFWVPLLSPKNQNLTKPTHSFQTELLSHKAVLATCESRFAIWFGVRFSWSKNSSLDPCVYWLNPLCGSKDQRHFSFVGFFFPQHTLCTVTHGCRLLSWLITVQTLPQFKYFCNMATGFLCRGQEVSMLNLLPPLSILCQYAFICLGNNWHEGI